ncbi:uncharacterized protein HKW66_Vig0042160 [Vigna angularis]|uniref:Uncharacterized protein n=1 Tax=Phaseolus angularis TaxID=3914 RepID=A0A8T0L005_PHAAN|nr:uncharacterized protein HKW66_Vig0042160 [Vigna angularis]
MIGFPKRVQRAGSISIQSNLGFIFATPMEETNRARVEISVEPTKVITTETVLVPPMIDGSDLHPFLDFGGVIPLSPLFQIDDHHPRVEVVGFPIGEGEREPERRGEIRDEVGVAVFEGNEDLLVPQRGICQLGNVVENKEEVEGEKSVITWSLLLDFSDKLEVVLECSFESMQVNVASTQDEDDVEEESEEEEEGNYYEDAEEDEECYDNEDGDGGCLLDELCVGLNNISVNERLWEAHKVCLR